MNLSNAKGIEITTVLQIYSQQIHQIGLQLFNVNTLLPVECQELTNALKVACEKIEYNIQELKSLI